MIHFEDTRPKETKKRHSYFQDFNRLWNRWPKKARHGKPAAFKSYKLKLVSYSVSQIAIQAHDFLSDLEEEKWRHCCWLQKFLNQELTDDFEYAEEKPKAVSPPGWDAVECIAREWWGTITTRLIKAGHVSKMEAHNWLSDLKIISMTLNKKTDRFEVVILTPTVFTRDYVRSKYGNLIREFAGRHIEIEAYKEGESYG